VDASTNTYTYGYDDRGRLIEALGMKGTNKVNGYPFRYRYDRVGNRIEQTEGTSQDALRYNRNNQLVERGRTNAVRVRGWVNEPGTVELRSDTATNWVSALTRFVSVTQTWFEGVVVATNWGWGKTNTIWVRATDASGNRSSNRVRVTGSAYAPRYSWDGAGNLVSSTWAGSPRYEWDAENWLIRIAYTNGESRLRYDGFGRLRELAEYGTNAGPTGVVRYVWNGWQPVGELDSSNRLIRTFTWGPDLSGTLGGAGGIGGLLAIRERGTNYYCRTDGKGNVTEVCWSNGTVRASYTYAPFGALLSQTNTYNQPFRFQTKLHHARSGLVYFGYRWYDPATGRWFSRDPLEEHGGINLYAYCANNPVNFTDPLGLWTWDNDWIELGLGSLVGLGPEGSFGEAWGGFAEGWSRGGQGVVNAFTGGLFWEEYGLFYDTFNKQWEDLGYESNECNEGFKMGMTGGRVAESALLAAGGVMGLEKAGILGRYGLINQNRYLRIGVSRFGGRKVYRAAGRLIEKITKDGHIIFRDLGPL
jgi:RHS repeat-associated protein